MSKTIKIISTIVSFAMILWTFAFPSVYASESTLPDAQEKHCLNSSDIVTQRNNITDILNDSFIDNLQFLYNLDGSPDFLH